MFPELSVVVAVYNEDPRNLLQLLERLWKAISPTGLSYEVIFVNDGSGKDTTAALRQIASEVNYVKLIELSRNFGQQAAITAGLDHAEGHAIVNLDSDLQDPPELIPSMVKCWREGYDVVFAHRSTRRDRVGKRLSAFLFYRVLGALSSVRIPWDTGDFRLMDRKVVQALRSLPEKTRFLRGHIPWLGFKQIGIPIDRGAREMGESAYTLRKLVTLALDGLLAFSVAPLYWVPIMGFFVLAFGIAATIFGVVRPSLVHIDNFVILAGLAILTGVQIICTGFMSVYVSKIMEEVRGRPTYIVSDRLGLGFARSGRDNFQTSLSLANQSSSR
jgi:glycosyltransferase involved in cell wall biosynthesis